METEKLKQFSLAIIGGCLGAQPFIPQSKLYHRQFRKQMKADKNTAVKIVLSKHFDLSYTDRLKYLESNTIDGILLHIRPTAVIVKNKVLCRNERNRSFFINPFLFNRSRYGWMSEWSRYQIRSDKNEFVRNDIDTHNIRKSKFGFGFFNSLLGVLLGLHYWAVKDELKAVKELHDLCQQKGIKLFVLGPTPYKVNWIDEWLCKNMTAELRKALDEQDIPFCCFQQATSFEGENLLKLDGHHLNSDGHTFLAKYLFNKMGSWVESNAHN